MHLRDDLVNGLQFPRAFEQRIEGTLTGEKAQSVLIGVLIVERAQVRVQTGRVRLGDDQRDALGADIDLVDGRQGQQPLIAGALVRVEDPREPFLDLAGRLVAQVGAGGGRDAG